MWSKQKGDSGGTPLPNETDLLKLGVSLNNKLTINGVEQTAGAATPAKPFQGKKYRAYGDSITAWGNANGYVSLVATDQGMSAVNQGRAGWTIWSGSGSNGSIADLLITDAPSSANCDLITFTGGMNHSGNFLGAINDTATTTTYGALNVVAQYCLTNNIKLVFITPTQYGVDRTNYRYTGTTDARNAMIDVGAKYSIPVLDLYAISGITVETSSKYLSDGIHPNDEGYRVMAAHLSRFLSNMVL
jgi:lysophospholipase L1-like esterase